MDGGGFGYSQFGGFGDTPTTPAAKNYNNVYIPVDVVTIQNNMSESTEKLSYGGHDFGNVEFLGQIESLVTDPTKVELRVKDDSGAGSIKVTIFVADPDQTKATYIEGATVRVFGRLRSFAGEKSITSFRVFVLSEAEVHKSVQEVELARAMWEKDIMGKVREVMATGNDPYNLKGVDWAMMTGTVLLPESVYAPKDGGGGTGFLAGGGAPSYGSTFPSHTPYTGQMTTYSGVNRGAMSAEDSLKERVKNAIATLQAKNDNPNGVSSVAIAAFLESVKLADVKSICEKLEIEGDIFCPQEGDNYQIVE